MPRPRLRRKLCINPDVFYFKPRGVPLNQLKVISVTREELEAFWLVDVKGYEQTRAARHMGTSQSTIQRILQSARKKTAQALIEGKAVAIEK
ncbi:MAG: DUF134 domain-containing protein [Patescibacteria group bacterium]|jgi:predicted DNA-binding protein (UPF0251 family)